MTVPGTGQTVKMTNNNGTGLVSPIPSYAETVSVVGREYMPSQQKMVIKRLSHFMKLYGYDPTTFKGAGIVIAVLIETQLVCLRHSMA